jgi:DNA-binding transcriptional ArsR family regulator
MINHMVNYYPPTPTPTARPEAGLDAVFRALSHPARRAMLERLGRGPATVGELAEPLGMSAPAVTKHIRVLARARLISQGRHARWRPCRLEEASLQVASDWIEEQRRIWEARLDRLEAHLGTMTDTERGTDDDHT